MSTKGKPQRRNSGPKLRGGLDQEGENSLVSNSPKKDETVPLEVYQRQQENSWNSRVLTAFSNGCSEYLTTEAGEYYGTPAPGREPFYCYLRIDFIIRLSLAFGRKLTKGELELLVAEDGPSNSEVCVHKLNVGLKKELDEINKQREKRREPRLELNQIRVTEDLITLCRFTPVRWVALPSNHRANDEFFGKVEETKDLLKVLAHLHTWRYLGSFFEREFPGGKVKRMATSGAPWKFFEHWDVPRYDTFPDSSLVMMFKMNPHKTEACATVGRKYIDKLYKKQLDDNNQPDTRELKASAAEDIWDSDFLDTYAKVLETV